MFPTGFEVLIQNTGSYITHDNHVERCYYQGFLQGRTKSAVAVSTCDGLSKKFFVNIYLSNGPMGV